MTFRIKAAIPGASLNRRMAKPRADLFWRSSLAAMPAANLQAELAAMIRNVEAKRNTFDALLHSLRETQRLLNDADDKLESTEQVASEHPVTEPDGMTLLVARFTSVRSSQFQKTAKFFVSRQNQWATVVSIATAIVASRSATTNILYRTQKEAFESRRVAGQGRLREWRLRPELYEALRKTTSE